uniref:Geranylgeranyl transferase type-2 subunit beta n=1 Tax=Angiostrongylus cantonensis TaxID=6313 RepID=A0A158PCG8_ANGCA
MSFAGFLDIARKDVDILKTAPNEFLAALHLKFITRYEKDKDSYEYIMAEPLRLSGIYWCVSAASYSVQPNALCRDEIVQYTRKCQRADGGFAPAAHHDSHLLHTLSAVQILTMYDALEGFDLDSIAEYVRRLQNEDGSFGGDISNEVDTRFSFCAVATLYLIDKLHVINVDRAVDFVLSCYNFDGGFGTRPGSESHAGQVYCCLGTLCITRRLDSIDRDRTAEWLAQRQCASGGLNGRPEKLPDVCYSWWVLASLAILKRLHWVDKNALVRFIYACQDSETGGFADRPGDCPDPFHTLFGIAGLSLLDVGSLQPVDAVLCMPKHTLKEKCLC